VQVDPIKPTLKAPGTWRLKLKHCQLHSSCAFNFNLRRFTKVTTKKEKVREEAAAKAALKDKTNNDDGKLKRRRFTAGPFPSQL